MATQPRERTASTTASITSGYATPSIPERTTTDLESAQQLLEIHAQGDRFSTTPARPPSSYYSERAHHSFSQDGRRSPPEASVIARGPQAAATELEQQQRSQERPLAPSGSRTPAVFPVPSAEGAAIGQKCRFVPIQESLKSRMLIHIAIAAPHKHHYGDGQPPARSSATHVAYTRSLVMPIVPST